VRSKPVLRSFAVDASEKDRDADDCPNCGTRVESDISGPGEQLRESTQRRCPNCGKILRRVVGGKWTIDETER
jgi:ribosomal protein S27AE